MSIKLWNNSKPNHVSTGDRHILDFFIAVESLLMCGGMDNLLSLFGEVTFPPANSACFVCLILPLQAFRSSGQQLLEAHLLIGGNIEAPRTRTCKIAALKNAQYRITAAVAPVLCCRCLSKIVEFLLGGFIIDDK